MVVAAIRGRPGRRAASIAVFAAGALACAAAVAAFPHPRKAQSSFKQPGRDKDDEHGKHDAPPDGRIHVYSDVL